MSVIQQLKPINIYVRIASVYHFVLEGGLIGIWACYLPSIQDSLNISDGALGGAVLLMYLGTVMATHLAGILMRKFGTRIATFVGAISFSLGLPLIALAPNMGWLCATMFFFGYGMGVMDVSMNGAAVLTEMVAEKPLLNSVHASYSAAAAVSSAIAGVLSSKGFTALPVYTVTTAIAVVASCVAATQLYSFADEVAVTKCHNEACKSAAIEVEVDAAVPASSAHAYEPVSAVVVDESNPMQEGGGHGNRTQSAASCSSTSTTGRESKALASSYSALLHNATFMNLCAIGFLASFGEVSMTAWSVIYFKRYYDASTLAASVGFSVFMVCMAVGRLCGDTLREWYGRRMLMRACGVLLVVGMGVLLSSPSMQHADGGGGSTASSLYVGYMGAALVGCGLSILIPTVFSSSGHLPGVHAGSAIAVAAALTYAGSFISPLFLGLLSEWMHSLRYAFVIDAVLLGAVFFLSFNVPPEVSHWFSSRSGAGSGTGWGAAEREGEGEGQGGSISEQKQRLLGGGHRDMA